MTDADALKLTKDQEVIIDGKKYYVVEIVPSIEIGLNAEPGHATPEFVCSSHEISLPACQKCGK